MNKIYTMKPKPSLLFMRIILRKRLKMRVQNFRFKILKIKKIKKSFTPVKEMNLEKGIDFITVKID